MIELTTSTFYKNFIDQKSNFNFDSLLNCYIEELKIHYITVLIYHRAQRENIGG